MTGNVDPSIGEAHAVLAQNSSDKGNLLDAALEQARRAYELDPTARHG